ncbi:uncharacterized protein BJ212DRAFT_1298652 [Suillus subaureus]|uniref:Uncharacterized protein n=1 Tax=Suillus subaureus TaxID=48587 RepID=A0A9P7EDI6_9AGAM|nr:uncharacterized protein BJ212DRAFT_1298652 [Suillus subaureus]KAG1818573.1 hypothetical protein BJ212DRAFT_1298652 [Suillus subaureus]
MHGMSKISHFQGQQAPIDHLVISSYMIEGDGVSQNAMNDHGDCMNTDILNVSANEMEMVAVNDGDSADDNRNLRDGTEGNGKRKHTGSLALSPQMSIPHNPINAGPPQIEVAKEGSHVTHQSEVSTTQQSSQGDNAHTITTGPLSTAAQDWLETF